MHEHVRGTVALAEPSNRRRDREPERELEPEVRFPLDARDRPRLVAPELGGPLEQLLLLRPSDSLPAPVRTDTEREHLRLRQTERRAVVRRADLLDEEGKEAGDGSLVAGDEDVRVSSEGPILGQEPPELTLELEQLDEFRPAGVPVVPLLNPDAGHGEPSLPSAAAQIGLNPMSAREFFESLESRVDESKTAGMNNSYLFDIDGAGVWLVRVEGGKVNVTEGEQDADAVIKASEETFEKLVSGEQNPTSAYMTGKLKVKGDMGAAMKLQKLF